MSETNDIKEFIDKIHLGKWETVMPKIPDSSVDIIITSPPYNVDLGKNKSKNMLMKSIMTIFPMTSILNG